AVPSVVVTPRSASLPPSSKTPATPLTILPSPSSTLPTTSQTQTPLRRIASVFKLALPRPTSTPAPPLPRSPLSPPNPTTNAPVFKHRSSISSTTTDVTMLSVTTVGGGKEKKVVSVRRKVAGVFGFGGKTENSLEVVKEGKKKSGWW
ncbi:hypothetical protein HK097_000634, partial [Rhizophlyctis rosea]